MLGKRPRQGRRAPATLAYFVAGGWVDGWRLLDAEPLHSLPEILAADAERSGRLAQLPAMTFACPEDEVARLLPQRGFEGKDRPLRRRRRAPGLRGDTWRHAALRPWLRPLRLNRPWLERRIRLQRAGIERLDFGEQAGALDTVSQLAHVARPAPGKACPPGIEVETTSRSRICCVPGIDEALGEPRHVLRAFVQQGHRKVHDVDSVGEVFAGVPANAVVEKRGCFSKALAQNTCGSS